MFNKIGLSRTWGYTVTKLNGYWCMSVLVLGFEWSGTFPYITVCNLGFLDSQFLLKDRKLLLRFITNCALSSTGNTFSSVSTNFQHSQASTSSIDFLLPLKKCHIGLHTMALHASTIPESPICVISLCSTSSFPTHLPFSPDADSCTQPV